jgi:hypothetical protein
MTQVEEVTAQIADVKITNKGTGAGGANTTKQGKKFEELTQNEENLINQGFIKEKLNKTKTGYCYKKKFDDKEVLYFTQGGLKIYLKQKFNINLFRHPDEAYIIIYNNGKKVLKILEKKNQNVGGSVDIKLYAGNCICREYQKVVGDDFTVKYAFCVSLYFQNKFNSEERKYEILKEIFDEDNIELFFGEDIDYFDKLNKWINSS